jgi:hypothetical protein
VCPCMAVDDPTPPSFTRDLSLVTLRGPARPQMGLAPVETCPTQSAVGRGELRPEVRDHRERLRHGHVRAMAFRNRRSLRPEERIEEEGPNIGGGGGNRRSGWVPYKFTSHEW